MPLADRYSDNTWVGEGAEDVSGGSIDGPKVVAADRFSFFFYFLFLPLCTFPFSRPVLAWQSVLASVFMPISTVCISHLFKYHIYIGRLHK